MSTQPHSRSVPRRGAVLGPASFRAPDYLSGVTSWHGHIPFAFWCIDALRPGIFVELGTHLGDSYMAFCQAVHELRTGTKCYAVDTWMGDEHAGGYGEEVYATVDRYNTERFVQFSRLIRSTFDDALTHFADGSVDLLHIDGLHTYEAVKQDFESWLPKLSERGVVLFHDINVRERDFGVWRLWEELGAHFPNFAFLHSHGLGVLAVGADAPDAVTELCACDAGDARDVQAMFERLGQCIAATSERDQAIQQLAAVYRSSSWRVTRPLRSLMRLLRPRSVRADER